MSGVIIQIIQIFKMVSNFHLMKTVLKTCFDFLFDFFGCIIVLALNSFNLLVHGGGLVKM